ncbi:YicC/YloC family endoribonuclease [Tissierella sp. Yu-01]|uniref:YicC/YloC family endoribonuclease n=1 Tax=Tissierella sp. Yu-01 TaxID=3035694 RepID=UPI00240E7AEF|nr:YicC/YloC family endoribonuclease [Tissierella sp. Yu-01]WFA09822.1 YicC family protein [Tissierella sp. Yu-01]
MNQLIKSMTGYGKGEAASELYKFKVEIKAVNHRYSDISIKIPRHISYFEEKIKKIIKDKISRGKIDIYINLEYISESAIEVKVDIPLAKAYKEALDSLTEELNLNDEIKLNNILSISEVVRTDKKDLDEDLIWNTLKEALDIALENILKMRVVEGTELKNDIMKKLDNIEEEVNLIAERAPSVVLEYRERLRERIKNLLDDNVSLDEERLCNEIAFFADKSSIDEEIVRLYSHIKQFRAILNENNSIGRKLDFLIQELNREINTIGSKANDIIIAKYVVNLKSELEKIREQIQNIE